MVQEHSYSDIFDCFHCVVQEIQWLTLSPNTQLQPKVSTSGVRIVEALLERLPLGNLVQILCKVSSRHFDYLSSCSSPDVVFVDVVVDESRCAHIILCLLMSGCIKVPR